MSLGEKLMQLRKKEGFSQEEVAEKLNVTRRTVSKWETDQTVPELSKLKSLSQIYNIRIETLISENLSDSNCTSMEAAVDEIDWTRAWSKKYPILAGYQETREIDKYKEQLEKLYDEFKKEFDFSDTDTVLILKDILYQKFKKSTSK